MCIDELEDWRKAQQTAESPKGKVREIAEKMKKASMLMNWREVMEKDIRDGLKEFQLEAQRELWRRLEDGTMLKHGPSCAAYRSLRPNSWETMPCDCGLDELRKELFG